MVQVIDSGYIFYMEEMNAHEHISWYTFRYEGRFGNAVNPVYNQFIIRIIWLQGFEQI